MNRRKTIRISLAAALLAAALTAGIAHAGDEVAVIDELVLQLDVPANGFDPVTAANNVLGIGAWGSFRQFDGVDDAGNSAPAEFDARTRATITLLSKLTTARNQECSDVSVLEVCESLIKLFYQGRVSSKHRLLCPETVLPRCQQLQGVASTNIDALQTELRSLLPKPGR